MRQQPDFAVAHDLFGDLLLPLYYAKTHTNQLIEAGVPITAGTVTIGGATCIGRDMFAFVRTETRVMNQSLTSASIARCAALNAPSVMAFATASEFAIAIRPNGLRAASHGDRSGGSSSSIHAI